MVNKESVRINPNEAFAAYSLPGFQDHNLVMGRVALELTNQGGFIVQDFEKHKGPARLILPDFLGTNTEFHFDIREETKMSSTSQASYLEGAKNTIDSIQSGLYDKVVISKVKLVPRNEQDIFDTFISLKNKYPNAFVFAYHLPGEGLWIGASPELLIKEQNDRFLTMALAGTQKDMSIRLDDVLWGQKEIEEHAIIERFIEEIFSLKNISYTKSGPTTVKAGNVLHIQSQYEFRFGNDIFDLIDNLHPGPAICGIPRKEVFSFIKQIEGHRREHYCGYLGPWNILDKKELYVNLRSMRTYKNQYALYLGGGLTRDSEPLKEWDETEMKARTLTSVINKAVSV